MEYESEDWDGQFPVSMKLTCDGYISDKVHCKRYITGMLLDNQVGYFWHYKFGTTDLRNFGYRCFQHQKKG